MIKSTNFEIISRSVLEKKLKVWHLVFAIVLFVVMIRPVSAGSALTGAWEGEIFGFPIEIAAWKNQEDDTNKNWIGYMYSPHHKCFMEVWFSVTGDGTLRSFSFSSGRVSMKRPNCEENINRKNGYIRANKLQEFNGSGIFTLSENSQSIGLDVKIHSYGGELRRKTYSMSGRDDNDIRINLTRRILSRDLLDFVENYSDGAFPKPIEEDFLSFSRIERSDADLLNRPSLEKAEYVLRQERIAHEKLLLPYKAIIERLEKGDLKTIADGDIFMDFHNHFITQYSDSCSSYINNPVSLEVTRTETSTNELGFISEEIIGTSTVTMESRYEEKFRIYFERSIMISTASLIGGILNNGNDEIKFRVEQELEQNKYLLNYIENNCSNEKLIETYENLYRKSHNLEPV